MHAWGYQMKDAGEAHADTEQLSPGARRQATYRDSQIRNGRRQRSFWLTDIEAESVRELIALLRSDEEIESQG